LGAPQVDTWLRKKIRLEIGALGISSWESLGFGERGTRGGRGSEKREKGAFAQIQIGRWGGARTG